MPSDHLAADQQSRAPIRRRGLCGWRIARLATLPVSWTTATFDHSTTGFLLTNGHANVACTLCHINNNYTLTIAPTDCGNSQCHLTTWQQTTTPVHSTSGSAFAAANCSTCHTTAGWTAAAFDHSVTGFHADGNAHVPDADALRFLPCEQQLHAQFGGLLRLPPGGISSTTTIGGSVPNHVTAGFPTTASACATCHPITTWAAGVFNHSATGFPLTNGHANVACNLCHINNNYSLTIAPPIAGTRNAI